MTRLYILMDNSQQLLTRDLVSGSHCLDVKVYHILTFLAEDMCYGLFHLAELNAEIRDCGSEKHHVGTCLELFCHLVGIE